MIIALDGKDFNNGLFRLAVPPRQLPRGSSPKKCFHGSLYLVPSKKEVVVF